ncbi:8711_t:CDS:2, partial [Gigaspora rosea]
NGIFILHHEEVNYKLDELCDSGGELTFFLDAKDKLKRHSWSRGKFVSDNEIDNNHLKHIIVNEN